MRFIYVDEAGTSDLEPISLVAGIIVEADTQLAIVENLVKEVVGAVPAIFRRDFIFHALDVWHDGKYRSDWSLADRMHIMTSMMGIPRKLGLPIAVGMQRRDSPAPSESLPTQLTKSQWDHLMCFGYCLCKADANIRDHGGPTEIGTVVAEDLPSGILKQLLKKAPTMWRESFVHKPGHLRPRLLDKQQGYMTQRGEMRVTRIRDIVHFVEKGDDAILQVADAVAFGLRRYFSGQSAGQEFIEAILGFAPPLADWDGPSNYACWSHGDNAPRYSAWPRI
ncbi:DUF3800 domain-containing protein [Reyranella sp. MMS21-HV4-11]|uniref:DUF3800 domain-containing protein n=1 Tax=Reyranella humidisoli TaxID=2849149 RepID=A0ABS6IP73_9HYPH|nr:DUF3800 domain-containing protein [Reyranella sp. MMS21-HV4-11]MBU8876118.1 DUF3800 domain-containing protein [Reyranella sp. MMS21-HV4-11]